MQLDPLYLAVAKADARQFFVAVTVHFETAAPTLRLEDMSEDIKRLGASVAAIYTNDKCVFLHGDELESECRVALANVLRKNWLTRAKSRVEFFKVLKAAMRNQMRTLVQRHCFTQKRTGIKPPPRHERPLTVNDATMSNVATRPVEISLDDPDAHLQVGDEDVGMHEDDYDTKELMREIREHLMPVEQLVFDQLISPNITAFHYATLDAYRGGNPARIEIRVTQEHMAQGIKLSFAEFEKSVLVIQQVTERLRAMNPEDQQFQSVVQELGLLFKVQVPKSTPEMVVRRLFTIAARDNWEKVTPDVEEKLTGIGALAPKFNKTNMVCYGALYQRGDRRCESCGVKVSCAAQAANVGLGEITIHPKLLGKKLERTPYIMPGAAGIEPPPTTSVRDMEIVDYLWRNFKQVTHLGEIYFQPIEFSNKEKMLFCLGESAIPLRLRFCNPSQELRRKLVHVNKGYYVNEHLSAQDVVELIDEHTKCAYA